MCPIIDIILLQELTAVIVGHIGDIGEVLLRDPFQVRKRKKSFLFYVFTLKSAFFITATTKKDYPPVRYHLFCLLYNTNMYYIITNYENLS